MFFLPIFFLKSLTLLRLRGAEEATTSVDAKAIQIHPDQQRMNQYILAELAKVKKDNKRLNDELLALRMENMSLSSRIEARIQAPVSDTPTYGLPIRYGPQTEMFTSSGNFTALTKPQQELPFVEFDMRRQPPTVQSANVMFCSLLGYTTEEVLGKPWQYFIQNEYVERTIRMLNRDSGSTQQVQLGQVYKDRQGRPIPCQDLHTFNRDESGRVITDYVVVRPEGTPDTGVPVTPMARFGGVSQPISLAAKRPVPSIMGTGGDMASFGTSPLEMMDESNDGFSPSPPPPPMLSVSGEWSPGDLGVTGTPLGLPPGPTMWDLEK